MYDSFVYSEHSREGLCCLVPDLYFELNSFSAVMPRHWKKPRESAPGKPADDAA